jgi:hypothetical protein
LTHLLDVDRLSQKERQELRALLRDWDRKAGPKDMAP